MANIIITIIVVNTEITIILNNNSLTCNMQYDVTMFVDTAQSYSENVLYFNK